MQCFQIVLLSHREDVSVLPVEKYADGYEQMDLFNEAEANADTDAAEIEEEIVIPSHKRKKRTGKKEEDLSNFEVTETIEYKLTGEDRYCPDCGTKYKVVTKEVVKRLKFIPSTFEVEEEVTYVYSCPKMWCYDPAGKRVSTDQGKHCYSFTGCRNHECKVCQWYAAGKTGT